MTETTVLRVSHNIRLDVASYKVTSNMVLDHRQHIDGKVIQDIESVIPVESDEKTNSVYQDSDVSLFSQYFILMIFVI